MSDSWDAIFVGSGISSLACCAMLVQRDPHFRGLILDKHHLAGGYATNFTRPNHQATFDCSLHKLSGMGDGGNLQRILDHLNILDEIDVVNPSDYFSVYCGDRILTLPNNVSDCQGVLEQEFPLEISGIRTFFDHVASHGKTGYHQFQIMDGSIEPCMSELRYAHRVLKVKTVEQMFDDLFDDPLLKAILAAPGIYVGGLIGDLGYLYYLHVVYATLNVGNAYLKGGAQKLSDLLVKRIRSSNSKVQLKTNVRSIICDDSSSIAKHSVHTNRGTFSSDQVFINASPHYAIKSLIQSEADFSDTKRKLSCLTPSRSTTTLYAVSDRPPEDYGLISTESMFFRQDHLIKASNLFHDNNSTKNKEILEKYFWEQGALEVTNYHMLDPEAGYVLCLNVLDSIDHWPDRKSPEYRKKKKRAESVLIKRLTEQLPSLAGHLTYTELSTPRTYERYTNNTAGAGYGAMIGTDIHAHTFHYGFPVHGIQFLSAWVAGPSYEAAFGYAERCVKKWNFPSLTN